MDQRDRYGAGPEMRLTCSQKYSPRECVKSWGQIAYEAYRNYTGGKSLVSGSPLPEWWDLAPEIKMAWEHVGQAVEKKVLSSSDLAGWD